MDVLPELLLAPLLVAVSILAGRRWGERVSGLVSSFPAVVGPVLMIAAQEHGASFTARSANGTLLGLATLAAFTVVYARLAGRFPWGVSLAGGWMAAAAVAIPVRWLAGELGFPVGLFVSVIFLGVAYVALPAATPSRRRDQPEPLGGGSGSFRAVGGRRDIILQMGLTIGLVGGLAVAGAQLGPTMGGILAALPVLASVLATRTHRRYGRTAVVALLRGMLSGMGSFVGFCAVVALLVTRLGAGGSFALAVLAAVALQVTALDRGILPRVAR